MGGEINTMEQPHRMAIAIWDIESGVAVSFIENTDILFEKGCLFCLILWEKK